MQTEELGQLFTMGLPGPRLNETMREFIKVHQPGGFILFGRNLESPAQVRELCDELRALCHVIPILTIDQEGGRVSRLKEVGEQPPSAEQLRMAGRMDWITEHGQLTGRLLRLYGFNLNLAPVADILLDPEVENSLLNRCYGLTADEVIQKAGAFLNGMQSEGVCGCVKHFPGYSLCGKDPHGSLPLVDRTREELEEHELKVFRALLPRGETVMIGHAVYPTFETEKIPSSLSRRIVKDFLLGELNYQGLVMTDDLEMGAISYEYGPADVVRRAIRAGNDLLLFCHQREMIEIAVRTLAGMDPEEHASARQRMATFKTHLSPPRPWSMEECNQINESIRALREKVESASAHGLEV